MSLRVFINLCSTLVKHCSTNVTHCSTITMLNECFYWGVSFISAYKTYNTYNTYNTYKNLISKRFAKKIVTNYVIKKKKRALRFQFHNALFYDLNS